MILIKIRQSATVEPIVHYKVTGNVQHQVVDCVGDIVHFSGGQSGLRRVSLLTLTVGADIGYPLV